MGKFEDWLNSAPLAGMIGAAFLTGAIYGRGLADISWETLAAGFLGLIGGFLAFLAATTQQRAIEKRNSFSFGIRTHQIRNTAAKAIQELQDEKFDWKVYSHADHFITNVSPLMEETLAGNDPLEPYLAQLVAKTSYQLLEAKEISSYAINARNQKIKEYSDAFEKEWRKPMAEYKDVTIRTESEEEVREIKKHFETLAQFLDKIDEHFKFHDDIRPRSSN